MAFFKDAKMQQAYLKAGFLGFAGSGKTHTSCLLAIGLAEMLGKEKPVAFVDTETGSDFWVPRFKSAGIGLKVVKQRAFQNLIPICQEAEGVADILIVDSITAFWNDLMESYKKKKNRKFISFPDWGILKAEWKKFTDWYINSPIHCIICGRAGWEYNEYTDNDGKDHLEKTGTKMKAETEFGYEPSFLIEMERVKVGDATSKIGQRVIHRAHILKDRNDVLDGKSFDDPSFDAFLPTIKLLSLGGEHLALDTETSSEEMFEKDTGRTEWQKEEGLKQIAYEELQGFVEQNFPASVGSDRIGKLNLYQFLFGTTSRTAIEGKKKDELKEALAMAKLILSKSENVELLTTKGADLTKLKVTKEG